MGNPELFVDSTTVCGSVAITSTGNITLISSAGGAIYVYAYQIAAPSTIANNGLTVRLMSGSTTAECWRTTLTGASSAVAGIDAMAVTPPAYIFRTNPGEPLTYEKGGSSVAGALTSYSFAYWRQ